MSEDPNNLDIYGNFVKIARLRGEWFGDFDDPVDIIQKIKTGDSPVDIFTFWQKFPEVKPQYAYHMEWNDLAILSLISYDHWFKKQINRGARRAILKAEAKGVSVTAVEFSDDLVQKITTIYNETPVRQGRPYTYYGYDFDMVKKDLLKDIHRSIILGAFYKEELIGFIQLGLAGQYAVPFGMVSKLEHRDKSPQNALIAKAVNVCLSYNISCLIYGLWSRGPLTEFKIHNGFEKVAIPRYYIPLTVKGTLALKLRFHRGLDGILPEKLTMKLLDLRRKWYSRKYTTK